MCVYFGNVAKYPRCKCNLQCFILQLSSPYSHDADDPGGLGPREVVEEDVDGVGHRPREVLELLARAIREGGRVRLVHHHSHPEGSWGSGKGNVRKGGAHPRIQSYTQ